MKNLLQQSLNKKNFSWFITGFTDAEGCFYISVVKNPQFKTGWKVLAFFEIHIHKKDIQLLKDIKEVLGGVGRIIPKGKNAYSFRVNILKELLNTIIPHFDNYPLITQKFADYLLWKRVVFMMKEGKHLTNIGIKDIINIKASLNKGLSSDLYHNFEQVIPVSRLLVENQKIPDEAWFSGFASGDGSFFIRIGKSLNKVKFKVQLVFAVSQHIRDEKLLKSFRSYLGCGFLRIHNNRNIADYICSNFEDIYNKIIPFFKEHNIKGIKSKDFCDWVKVAEYIKKKEHLTLEGYTNILKIKSTMNKGRKL